MIHRQSCLPVFLAAFFASIPNVMSQEKQKKPQLESVKLTETPDISIHVTASRKKWTFVYAGRDKKFDTADDHRLVNNLVVPSESTIRLVFGSSDVNHEFTVPDQKIRHDVIAGRFTDLFIKTDSTPGRLKMMGNIYSGEKHAKNIGDITVVNKNEIEKQLKERLKKNKKN